MINHTGWPRHKAPARRRRIPAHGPKHRPAPSLPPLSFLADQQDDHAPQNNPSNQMADRESRIAAPAHSDEASAPKKSEAGQSIK